MCVKRWGSNPFEIEGERLCDKCMNLPLIRQQLVHVSENIVKHD